MSSVKWTQTAGRSSAEVNGVSYPVGGAWVLDIITGTGNTQMFFSTAYPSPGYMQYNDPPIYSFDALTEADSDGTAAALKTAVDALSGVVGSTLTAFSVTQGVGVHLLFDANWSNFLFNITLPTEISGQENGSDSAQLTTASPADGKLSQADIDTITASLVAHIKTLNTVADCSVVQSVVTPATI